MNKKHRFYFGFILATIIGLQSCETPREVIDDKPTDGLAEIVEVSFKSIANGYLTGDGAEEISKGGIVINSQAEWSALKTKMNSVNKTIDDPAVDFNKMTVLAYFDQIRGSGGYSVAFASISQTGNTVQTRIKMSAPKGDAIEIMTQPYSIVFIEKTDKTIAFTEL